MLHAFDAETGEELWAFIPPDLLPKLKNLTGNAIEFFVDGSPKAHIGDKKVLICGERRGGNRYFALDVSDATGPKWMWEIHPGLSDFAEMGQTWSSPLVGKVRLGASDQWALFIGGGYDTRQDDLPVTANDAMGRASCHRCMNGTRIKIVYADNAQTKIHFEDITG
jgi:type IV pilus assembly protein PilY1